MFIYHEAEKELAQLQATITIAINHMMKIV